MLRHILINMFQNCTVILVSVPISPLLPSPNPFSPGIKMLSHGFGGYYRFELAYHSVFTRFLWAYVKMLHKMYHNLLHTLS